MYQHILIATDGSDRSESAARHGVDLARALGAQVTAVTVSAPFQFVPAPPLVLTDAPERYETEAEATARERLSVIEKIATAGGVSYEGVHKTTARATRHESAVRTLSVAVATRRKTGVRIRPRDFRGIGGR
jgi:nucleotide-binding universal stress UspA family protein